MTEFEKTLEKMKILLGVAKDSEVAEAIGMKPSAFANRKKSESVPFSHYLKIVKSHNVNLNWFIYNEGPMYKDTTTDLKRQTTESDKENIIVIEHSDLVKNFKNPKKAKIFNEFLIEIEKTDPAAGRAP